MLRERRNSSYSEFSEEDPRTKLLQDERERQAGTKDFVSVHVDP